MMFGDRAQVQAMYIKAHKENGTDTRKVRQLTELPVALLDNDCVSVCDCNGIFPFLAVSNKGKS